MSYVLHSMLVTSTGDRGWYELREDNEVIEFKGALNTISVEAKTDLDIKINGGSDIWYLDSGRTEQIEGLTIRKIQVMNPKGTLIRWKGLIY